MPLPIITTVLTTTGGALTSLATVKNELAIDAGDRSQDQFLSRAIAQVSTAIGNYINRQLSVQTIQDVIMPEPIVTGHIQLSNRPVITVTSVACEDWDDNVTALVQGTDYSVDQTRGRLIALDDEGFPTAWPNYQTTVVYSAGYFPAIPPDVEDAALRMITARYTAKGRDPYLKGEDIPSIGRRDYWVGTAPGMHGAFPDDVVALLSSYRVPVFG